MVRTTVCAGAPPCEATAQEHSFADGCCGAPIDEGATLSADATSFALSIAHGSTFPFEAEVGACAAATWGCAEGCAAAAGCPDGCAFTPGAMLTLPPQAKLMRKFAGLRVYRGTGNDSCTLF